MYNIYCQYSGDKEYHGRDVFRIRPRRSLPLMVTNDYWNNFVLELVL